MAKSSKQDEQPQEPQAGDPQTFEQVDERGLQVVMKGPTVIDALQGAVVRLVFARGEECGHRVVVEIVECGTLARCRLADH